MHLLNKAYKYFWALTEERDRKRMEKQALPTGINAIFDIPYSEDRKNEHMLDVYFPEKYSDRKLPVIIDIHGGGLMYGNKELNKNYCYHLAERGFTVINVGYSLCPDNPYPCCIVDVMHALEYIGEHMDGYPCDRNRVFITGDSAGAMLAAYAVLISSSEELRKVYKTGKINTTRQKRQTKNTCRFNEERHVFFVPLSPNPIISLFSTYSSLSMFYAPCA